MTRGISFMARMIGAPGLGNALLQASSAVGYSLIYTHPLPDTIKRYHNGTECERGVVADPRLPVR
jgi:hypothetical protein